MERTNNDKLDRKINEIKIKEYRVQDRPANSKTMFLKLYVANSHESVG